MMDGSTAPSQGTEGAGVGSSFSSKEELTSIDMYSRS